MGLVRRRAPVFILVALVIVVAGVGVATRDDSSRGAARPEPPPATVLSGDEAVTRFLDAWERSRTGTFVMRSQFRRILTDGQRLERIVVTVQAPPEHLTIDGGSITGVLDGVRVACSVDDEGARECREGAEVENGAYSRSVDTQLETLAGYVTGPNRLYEVTVDAEDCFVLAQDRHLPAAPFGTQGRFCFDAETGALSFTEIARPEGTDRLEATEIRAEVTEADLSIPSA